MPETKIKQVALAIAQADNRLDLDAYVKMAQAAIEAMREPTEGMFEAYKCDDLWKNMNSRQVLELWIDAALNEAQDTKT